MAVADDAADADDADADDADDDAELHRSICVDL